MHDPAETILSGILDTPTVWLQLDATRDCGPGAPCSIQEHLLGEEVSAAPRPALPSLPLTSRLRRAFDSGAFSLAYQPFVDARTRRVLGAEALLRWTDPQDEASSPEHFVPALERTGLIIAVGEWVLREACLQMRRLCEAGAPACVSVNLSPRQFAQAHLADRIAAILKDSGLPACQLELEVTESMLEDIDRACATLHELRELGVAVLIDDFGVGYSSLNHLKRLPVAGLKLDRSFIAGMLESRPDRVITESIIRLAHELRLDVVAEGVEDRRHEAWLRDHGVTRLQGFLYSPPVPAAQLAEMLVTQPFAQTTRPPRRRHPI